MILPRKLKRVPAPCSTESLNPRNNQGQPKSAARTTRKNPGNQHDRGNPAHNSAIPRELLPPNRPHPGQSASVTRGAGHHRCWGSDTGFFEPSAFQQQINYQMLFRGGIIADFVLSGGCCRTPTFNSTMPSRLLGKCRMISASR